MAEEPFVNHKHWQLMTMGQDFSVLLKLQTDEQLLQFWQDQLAYNRFLLDFLTADDNAMAKAIDTEPRHIEYLRSQIGWNEESIANHEFSCKARAFARQKREQEELKNPKPDARSPDEFTLGNDVTYDTILALSLN